MSFGILTLVTNHDIKKAIGLALSLRVSNPGVKTAVVCTEALRPQVQDFFDHVVIEDPNLRGFQHKVYLDRYSPFDETFFFDSDVLVFRPLSEVLDVWRTQPYHACGEYGTGGYSPFGLDRVAVLKKIGKERLTQIDGAGHAYFRKPDCTKVFDLAREITANYREYAGDIRYADEDAMDIAMTILDYKIVDGGDFFSRHLSAKKGTMDMDASQGKCSFVAVRTGTVQRPHMMHFAAREAPFAHYGNLRKLYKKFRVPTKGLLSLAISDYYKGTILWTLKRYIKRFH